MMPLGAIVVGAHVNGLTVSRALWRAGVAVVVVRTRDWDIGHVSRAAAGSVDLRDFPSRPDALPELLDRRSRDWRGWAVYPTDDAALSVLLQRRYMLEGLGYRLIAGPDEAVETLLDKERTTGLAARLGIDLPACYGDAQKPAPNPGALRYPVVLKPSHSHLFREAFGGKKLFVADNPAQYEDCRRKLAKAGLHAQVLDLIPGPDSLFFNYSVYVDARGEPRAGLAMRKERKSPPSFGVCRVAHTRVDAEREKVMRDAVLAILREVGYRGMANAEFKLDERDGKLRLMEINARPFLMQGLAMCAGIDYPLMAWQDFVLGEAPRSERNGWEGAWIHLHADIGNALAYRKDENLRMADYLRPYRMPHRFAVFSWRDPAPFLLQWSRTLAQTAWRLVAPRRPSGGA
jgi:predicted ATP-grasp superfamily ATP-dependent carboligase